MYMNRPRNHKIPEKGPAFRPDNAIVGYIIILNWYYIPLNVLCLSFFGIIFLYASFSGMIILLLWYCILLLRYYNTR